MIYSSDYDLLQQDWNGIVQTGGHMFLKCILWYFEYIIVLDLYLLFIVFYLYTTVLMAIVDGINRRKVYL
jgi:hypothetical protein